MYTYTVLTPPKNNSNDSPTNIIVNGDGSSGTGDVTNTKVVETKVVYTDIEDNSNVQYGSNDSYTTPSKQNG